MQETLPFVLTDTEMPFLIIHNKHNLHQIGGGKVTNLELCIQTVPEIQTSKQKTNLNPIAFKRICAIRLINEVRRKLHYIREVWNSKLSIIHFLYISFKPL